MRGYKKGQKLRSKTNADYVVEIQFKSIEDGKTFYFTKSDINNKCFPYTKKELDEQFELIEQGTPRYLSRETCAEFQSNSGRN